MRRRAGTTLRGDEPVAGTGDGDLVRAGLPGFLEYHRIPFELSAPIRTFLNRYELSNGTALPRSITVTSALGGEGTTMVSQALSTVVAVEQVRSLCWFDCSWLGTRSRTTDQSATHPSLVDMLGDRTSLLEAMRQSPNLPQLTELRPGPVPSEKRHRIAFSREFEHLLMLLEEQFDHVVFDVPPLLDGGEGLPLLRHSDGYVLVVKQRATTHAQVQKAIEMAAPTPNVGVFLTNYTTKIPRSIQRLIGA